VLVRASDEAEEILDALQVLVGEVVVVLHLGLEVLRQELTQWGIELLQLVDDSLQLLVVQVVDLRAGVRKSIGE
jgi:hypothetical protein